MATYPWIQSTLGCIGICERIGVHIQIRLWITILLFIFITPELFGVGLLPHNKDMLTTESEHFRFIFQEPLKARIPALIKDFKDAYTLPNPVLNSVLQEKVTVLFPDT